MNKQKILFFVSILSSLTSLGLTLNGTVDSLALQTPSQYLTQFTPEAYKNQLTYAISKHDHPMLKFLLNSLGDTDINNIRDQHNSTLLNQAIWANNKQAIYMLFATGANPTITLPLGGSPLQLAKNLKRKTIFKMIQSQLELQKKN